MAHLIQPSQFVARKVKPDCKDLKEYRVFKANEDQKETKVIPEMITSLLPLIKLRLLG